MDSAGEPVVLGAMASLQAVLLVSEQHLQSAGLAWDVADYSCFDATPSAAAVPTGAGSWGFGLRDMAPGELLCHSSVCGQAGGARPAGIQIHDSCKLD